MSKPTNNVEMLTQFMNYGSELNQIFVIDAVTRLAELVVENEEQTLKHMEGGLIHGPAWVQCAKDFLKQSEEFYNRKYQL
jgi:tRNA G37 N-methylase TrmD